MARCVSVSRFSEFVLIASSATYAGYGATTFPGLTEAFTVDKNATLAQLEAKRLQHLIDALAETVKV